MKKKLALLFIFAFTGITYLQAQEADIYYVPAAQAFNSKSHSTEKLFAACQEALSIGAIDNNARSSKEDIQFKVVALLLDMQQESKNIQADLKKLSIGNDGEWFITDAGDWFMPLAAAESQSMKPQKDKQALSFKKGIVLSEYCGAKEVKAQMVPLKNQSDPITKEEIQAQAPAGSRYVLLFTMVEEQSVGSSAGNTIFAKVRPTMLVFF